ncbi:MAG: FctA domain-containing protein, partial [Clostridia bacterium]|nr:FctA domain-containing protein [Clostridia bacterium]
SPAIAFTNTYEAKGDITFEGAKALTGRKLTKDDVFTFTVVETGRTGVAATGASDETGAITFGKIEYSLDDLGTHTYTIAEDDTSIPGVTKDSTELTVVVEVTDNGDGTLTAEIVDGESDDITYTNTFAAEGDITFSGTKALTGRTMTADDKFTFTVTEGTETVATGANNGTGTITFTKIEYDEKDLGTHTYTITEDDTTITGVTKDSTSLTVTVTVSDNGDGTLKAEISSTSPAISFTNTYGAAGGITFEGAKTLTGRTMGSDDKFTFTVKEGGNVKATGANNGTETITFTEIAYTMADLGTHTYKITEDDTTLGGMTKDDTELTVVVEVTDNGDGTLKAEIVDTDSDDIEFTNAYEAEGDITFTGAKTLTGRTMTANDKFTFSVMKDGEKVASGANNGTGTITFDKISYTLTDAGKTYTYTITEDDTTIGGITKDATTKTVKVKITDNGDGTLKTEIVEESDTIAFTNTYEAKGDITFTGAKTLTGRTMTANDKFTFSV